MSSLLIILISFLTTINQVATEAHIVRPPVKGQQTHWLTDPQRNRNELLKKWLEDKRGENPTDHSSKLSTMDILHPSQLFKGI